MSPLSKPNIPSDVAQLLLRVKNANISPLYELSPSAARKEFERRSAILEIDAEEVKKTKDIFVDAEDRKLRMRLYWGQECTTDSMLLFVHGGGWVLGSIEGYDKLCRRLANRIRLPIASVDYRCAPESPFPAGLKDVSFAIESMRELTVDYNIKNSNWAIMGDSAGGNLAAAAISYQPKNAITASHQFLIYPVIDLSTERQSRSTYGEGFLLDSQLMKWFGKHYVGKNDFSNPRISIILNKELHNSPPTTIITAGLDPLCDEGKAYAKALTDNKVYVDHINYPDLLHGFLSMPAALNKTIITTDEICYKIRNTLVPKGL